MKWSESVINKVKFVPHARIFLVLGSSSLPKYPVSPSSRFRWRRRRRDSQRSAHSYTIMLSLTKCKRTENELFLAHLIYPCFTLQATVSEVKTTEAARKGDRYKAK